MKRAVIERSRMSEGDQPGFPKHKLFFFTGESKAAVETSQPTNFGLKKLVELCFLEIMSLFVLGRMPEWFWTIANSSR